MGLHWRLRQRTLTIGCVLVEARILSLHGYGTNRTLTDESTDPVPALAAEESPEVLAYKYIVSHCSSDLSPVRRRVFGKEVWCKAGNKRQMLPSSIQCVSSRPAQESTQATNQSRGSHLESSKVQYACAKSAWYLRLFRSMRPTKLKTRYHFLQQQ